MIYLDYAATTYLDPRVLKAMEPYLRGEYGNPSSLYEKGVKAKFALENSREKVAQILNCRPAEVVFTAGGTESINLAIFGVVREYLLKNKQKRPHIITTKIEHHAVLRSFEALSEEGVEATYLPVDTEGFVDLRVLKKAIKPNTILVSVMYANNEVGTVEPIGEIAKIIRKANAERAEKKLPRILFHTDACQAAGVLSLDVQKLGVDLLSLNGSKIYGPKQTGCLFVRAGIQLRPLIFGGGQEKDLRSGTENVAGIVGFAAAMEIGEREKKKQNLALRALRNYFLKEVASKIKNIAINGPTVSKDSDQTPTRLPNNINISFDDVDGEALMLYLDAQGFATSTGSACSSMSPDASHVIVAISDSEQRARESLRVSLGRKITKRDLRALLKKLAPLVQELRRVAKLDA